MVQLDTSILKLLFSAERPISNEHVTFAIFVHV